MEFADSRLSLLTLKAATHTNNTFSGLTKKQRNEKCTGVPYTYAAITFVAYRGQSSPPPHLPGRLRRWAKTGYFNFTHYIRINNRSRVYTGSMANVQKVLRWRSSKDIGWRGRLCCESSADRVVAGPRGSSAELKRELRVKASFMRFFSRFDALFTVS